MRGFRPPKRVLVAVDLSRPSLSALDAAKTLARRWGSTLELLNVDAGPAVFNPSASVLAGDHWWPWADFHEWREGRLRRAVSGFPAARVKIRRVQGWPPAVLAEAARSGGAGLVVVGTHGFAGLDRALFGSIAEIVVRKARVPVLAVHARRAPLKIARVLAPWNAQPYATDALRRGWDLARGLGARLTVLHVVPPWVRTEGLEARLRKTLESALGRGRWELEIRRGEPRAVVLRAADPRDYDLLVLSAHRRLLSTDAVLGSTAERVLRGSRLPVLAFPSEGGRSSEFPPAWLVDKIF